MDRLEELAAALPDGVVVTDPDVVEKYRYDWSGGGGEEAGRPLAVVRAEGAEQVQATLRWASAHRIPVVPRGAGSGLSGGATAVDGGIVLSLERMRSIGIDPAAHRVFVDGQVIELAAREYDLLHALMLNAGRVLNRVQLEQHLYSWGEEISSNAIEVHIHHLRRKLPPKTIETVRGVGYMMPKPASASPSAETVSS